MDQRSFGARYAKKRTAGGAFDRTFGPALMITADLEHAATAFAGIEKSPSPAITPRRRGSSPYMKNVRHRPFCEPLRC
jgi:hypothetical protein